MKDKIFAPNRRSIRMPEFDYTSDGLYYVTLCVEGRLEILGNIIYGQMHLSPIGQMIQRALEGIVRYHPSIQLDEFIVMPNHLHGIIRIGMDGLDLHCGRGQCPAPTISLSSIVGRFKSWTTNQYMTAVKQNNWPSFRARLWQRGYYEHIVRDESDLNRIRQYIRDNPVNWETDPENPKL